MTRAANRGINLDNLVAEILRNRSAKNENLTH